jgi:hypothetical protein
MRFTTGIFGLFLAVALVFGSCTFFTDFSDAEKAEQLEGVFLLSHLEATDMAAAYGLGSRAAAPASATTGGSSIALPTPAAVVVSNYPETNQTSSITTSAGSIANQWIVAVSTTFGTGWVNGVKQSVLERYYISDTQAPFNQYTSDDPIVTAAGATDPKARIEIATTYNTKRTKTDRSATSVRYDTITFGQGVTGYASFKTAPLTYDWAFSPASTTTGINWSSAVSYTQSLPVDQLALDEIIDTASKTFYLEGKRFYTEVGSASSHEASSIAFERVYDAPIVNGVSSGRLIAQAVIRVSYTRTNGTPSLSQVDSRAWYYLNAVDPPLEVSKTNSLSSSPLL